MEPHFMKISKIRRSIFPFQRLDFSGKNPERFNIPKTSSKYLAEVRPTSGRVFEVQSHASKCRLKDLDFPSEMAIFQKASKSQVHKKMGMVYTYRFVYDSCSATGGRCFFFAGGYVKLAEGVGESIDRSNRSIKSHVIHVQPSQVSGNHMANRSFT